MHIGLDAYRVFYYVARYRSFTKAAEILYSNQPNVTRAIKKLEQELGCALFLRTSRSVRLTPAGEELYAHVSVAMQQIRFGEELILRHRTLQGGMVSVGTSEIALHRVLLPVLEQFRRDYPGIRLRIFNSNSQQAVFALKENKVDFSLLTLPAALGEEYERTDISTFREVPVCKKSFLNPKQIPKSLKDLASFPLVSLCSGTSTHRLYSDWFQSHGLPFSPDVEAATADQILPLVRAGLGIGFLPEEAALDAAANESIQILSIAEQTPERTICLIKRKDTPLSIAAATLEQMLLSIRMRDCL